VKFLPASGIRRWRPLLPRHGSAATVWH